MNCSALGVGLDLELDRTARLTAVGAVRGSEQFLRDGIRSRDATVAALSALDAFAAQAPFVFGHNILWHDLPWLRQHAPDLELLQKPAIDTLLLSAIAFAQHPYHALLKDYKLVRDARNDPAADARLARQLLDDAWQRLAAIAATEPRFVAVVHALGTLALRAVSEPAVLGFALAIEDLAPPTANLDRDIGLLLADRTCRTALATLRPAAALPAERQLALLFAVAWLRVAGTSDQSSPSVMMPWVRRQVPQVTAVLAALRDRPCEAADCHWCRTVHDPVGQLQRWFRYPDFRSEPTLPDGRGAQRAIVEHGFAEQPLLALLPTGGGKSLCFQLPAITRYLRRGCLTIVISPLQSLMHDQVDNFAARTGARFAVALTGRLTAPERRATLDAVRMGEAGILYVSPEQLRNSTFRRTIALREIGAFVFDEAHCLSKWGHDFRPDYLYAARFILEFSEAQGIAPAPIVCVTATAKPEVKAEILQHFRDELGQQLVVFDGHASRQNLTLQVETTSGPEKTRRLRDLVAEQLTQDPTGSVLVYTATRKNAEQTAGLLVGAGIEASAFHAGLEVPDKKAVQQAFLGGACRVVCATNAFGMGIDKPDIRLVVHYEIPGSLEAYVQEVGRAGRDGKPANAVLLFAPDDIETQFRLAASSRLDWRDLRAILRRIRRLARPVPSEPDREAICTTGEILRDDEVGERIEPSDRGAPTRIVTAIAWLERGRFLRRDENATTVFQGRPLVHDLDEAKRRIAELDLRRDKAAAWLAVLARLLHADADEGLSSDDLLGLPGVLGAVETVDRKDPTGRSILRLLLSMQQARLLSTGVLMTAFVRHGVPDDSQDRLEAAASLEQRILGLLREQEPDPDEQLSYPLGVASLVQALSAHDPTATRDRVRSILAAMADRALHAGKHAPGLRLRFCSHDHCLVQLQGGWERVVATARRRHLLAHVCLQVMLTPLRQANARGATLLAQFGLEELVQALDQDLLLRSQPSPDPSTEIEYALLFLHRIDAIVLHKGLAVFRQAMILRVPPKGDSREFRRDDFAPLDEHQRQRTVQIHVMHEFAQRMAADPSAGLRLLDDYFRLPEEQFLSLWFRDRRAELTRATGPDSWRRIVHDLSRDQRAIVTASEDRSVLVLAGPGSGKTRVVVHRCAWLLRGKRVPASSILVLCYNRSAALELRSRLRDLVGQDAYGVLVQTYHGMAARLLGRSPAELLDAGTGTGDGDPFEAILEAAIALLDSGNSEGKQIDDSGAGDEVRDRLLGGFRHILVDEYQDIDEPQYRLVSALAGRTLADEAQKLSVLAVGDDDQNIYQWRGSNVQFLRQFETEYAAVRQPLVENYRSTAHIIAAANQLIVANRDRLKQDAPIRIDARRSKESPGGRFASLDPVGRGRVRVLEFDSLAAQAHVVLAELQRLRAVDPEFDIARCAVLSPRHALLDPVRAAFERAGIPVQVRVDREHSWSLFRMRPVQQFLAAVAEHDRAEIDGKDLRRLLVEQRALQPHERAFDLVADTLSGFVDEQGEAAVPKVAVTEFFGEVLREQRRERTIGEGVLLGTVHGSKGLEHDHVFVLDGGWQPREKEGWEDRRRLYYVAMTRARQTLTLLRCREDGAPWLALLQGAWLQRVAVPPVEVAAEVAQLRYRLLGLRELNLGFAGRVRQHREIDAAIARLVTGDRLRLVEERGRVVLQDDGGNVVGELARKAAAEWSGLLASVREVRVAAIVMRRRVDEADEFRDGLLRDEWQVVVPEVVCAM